MISSLETTISSWKPNQWLDFNEELSSATFNIVSTIFFGMDMDSKIEKVTYTELDDSQVQLPFKEFFIKLVEDIVKSSMNPLSTFFPFVIEYNLCKPYTTIEKNCVELRAVLKKFLDRSSDETSVYKQLVNKYNINEAQALQDIMSLLFAGHDTTSHAIGSAAYFLKAYPD